MEVSTRLALVVGCLLAAPRGGGAHARRGAGLCRAPRAGRAALARAAAGGGDGADGTDGESDALKAFRAQLQRQMSGQGDGSPPPIGGRSGAADLWASPMAQLDKGVVLFADHTRWSEGARGARGAPFEPFALRGPLPTDLPPDTLARVLPVVLVVSQAADGSHEALLLERRTGILLGDIKGDEYACAPINALLFGGVEARESVVALVQHDGPAPPSGCAPLFAGVSYGPWAAVRPLIEKGELVGTRCMVFAGKTGEARGGAEGRGGSRRADPADVGPHPAPTSCRAPRARLRAVLPPVFKKGDLERQLSAGYWKAARLSRDVLFKERSEPSMRKGSRPLWREGLELCEGEHARVVADLYGDEL